jgi:hypothetical protein
MPEIIRVRGFEYRWHNGRYEWRRPGTGPWFEDPYSPADYAALARLAERERAKETAA